MATKRAHEDSILSLCWLDASLLVTGSADEAVSVWRLVTEKDGDKEKHTLKAVRSHASAHMLGVTAVSAETGGHRFCSAGFTDIAIWSSDDGTRLASFDCGHLEAIGLRWSPAAGLLAGGTALGYVNFFRVGEDAAGGSVSISLASKVASRSASLVHCVGFSADGTRCAAGHADGSVTLIDTETLSVINTLEPHALPVRAIEFTSSGDALVTGSEDGRVGLTGTSAAAGSAVGQTATLSGHLGFVTGVAAAPGRARFASSSADKTVKLWDIGNADAEQTLTMHNDRVNALAWSVDASKLASVSDSGTLVVSVF